MHSPVLSMGHMASRRETLRLSCPPSDTLSGAPMGSLLGVYDLAALAAGWPTALQAPHMGSRREPEMNSSQEQAKLTGWGLRPMGSKGLYFKME